MSSLSLYRLLNIPFGICNGRGRAQTTISVILANVKYQVAPAYNENIVVLCKTQEEHK